MDVLPEKVWGMSLLPTPNVGWKALCPVGAGPTWACPYPAEGIANPDDWGMGGAFPPKGGGTCPAAVGARLDGAG